MDKPGAQDRNRSDQQERNMGQGQEGRDREGRDRTDRTDERGNVGQQTGTPTGTSGRDTDLQKEGNLGSERNRTGTRDQQDEESGFGNRPGQNR